VGPNKTGVNFAATRVTYSVSGTVTLNASGLIGVTVSAGGKSATTAANGTYTISGLVAGNYTVTASKTEHTFSPASHSVTLGPNKTGVDFTASVQTYSIAGRVTLGGAGLVGVTVSGGGKSAATAADGTYSLTGLAAGTYTVTASKSEFTFTPASHSVTVGPNRTGVDFAANGVTYTVSGLVTLNGDGLAGVTVSAGGASALTSAAGTYTISGLGSGTYTVTASKAEFAFAPASHSVTLGPNKTGVNFVATPLTYSISGTVTENGSGLAGVTVSGGGASALTGADGKYTLSNLAAGTYTVTASKAEYSFAPGSHSVAVGPNKSGVDFVGTRGTYSISGAVTLNGSGLAGVTITGGSASATTAADGSYTLTGLSAGTYTVAASKSEHSFAPASHSVQVGPNKSGVNFVATAATYSISGIVTENGSGLSGVTVTAGKASASTAADGSYTLSGLPAGDYAVTASRTNYSFTPGQHNVTVGPNRAGVDFVATRGTYSISGVVTAGGSGLAGVTISAGSANTTTGADGSYTISGLDAGRYTVTAGKQGYTMNPTQQTVTVGPSRKGVDFAATALTHSVSGVVTLDGLGLAGVQVSAGKAVAVTGLDGAYTLSGLTEGTYAVVASKPEHGFSPAQHSVSVGPNRGGVNFQATRVTYSISGFVTYGSQPAPGVTVQAGKSSAVTGVDGSYTIEGLFAGTHVVVAHKEGWSFSPPEHSVNVGPSKSSINFGALPNTYSISGHVLLNGKGLAGANVSIGKVAVTTGADGAYAFADLPAGEYTVRVSRQGYDFSPAEYAVEIGPSKSGLDFSANSARRATIKAVSIKPATVSAGSGATGTVALTDAAPEGGLLVGLFLSKASGTGTAGKGGSVSIPQTITVPAGSSSANFAVKTGAARGTSTYSIVASDGRTKRKTVLKVKGR
jgi:hypothetical protein